MRSLLPAEGSRARVGPMLVLVGCITGELVLSFLPQWVLLYKRLLICKVSVYFLMFNRGTLVRHCFCPRAG